MPSTVKTTDGLTRHYAALYTTKYGFKPHMNSYKARFGFDTMLKHMTSREIEELLEYYFKTINTSGHTLEWFFYNHENLAVGMEIQQQDRAQQEQIRSETQKRTEEWRKRIEDRSSGS